LSQFTIHQLPLAGLFLIKRTPQEDERGKFTRIFCSSELAIAGWNEPIVQINHTLTRQIATIRGLHYQRAPNSEMKLVQCLHGKVWDVVVDLRPKSPTYLKWHSEILSSDNYCAILVPPGLAHGFQSLVNDCEMLYAHSSAYCAGSEAGLRYDDPALSIDWPLPLSVISDRDQNHPLL
jgi:dTDP-4-dehydrorhamnose 3,5-epimerase